MILAVKSLNEFLVDNIGVIVTSLITIAGFIITYFLNRKNFRDELNKFKSNKAVELMQDIPYDLAKLLDLSKADSNKAAKIQNDIMLKICAYGSKDAVMIAEKYMQHSYSSFTKPIDAIAYIALLLSQMKFDITGNIILPTSWLKIKITDFPSRAEEITESINRIVDDNELNKNFKC